MNKLMSFIPTNLIGTLLPIVLRDVQKIPTEDKQLFAAYLIDICSSYLLDNDREKFSELLDQMSLESDLKSAIVEAVFSGNKNQ